jgi:ribonucleoside-diphosphate reductase alpha chain
MSVDAYFCPADVEDVFSTVEWEHRTAHIKDENGKVLFEQTHCEIPKSWSPLATNVVVSKYFYGEHGTAEREKSVQQVIHRVARTIADWGIDDGYFATPKDGENFYRELAWLCLHQHGAFNSPVWFNVGIFSQLGVKGSQGNYHFDPKTKAIHRPESSYEYPQGSACFIQSVDDSMEDIMRLATSEAMLFKYGSGTGTDLSTIRSAKEKLSGGGTPSGPLSFMRVYDQIAAVVKSGGKTRRAAKMQSIKDWHPDVLEFIQCKAKEERKARTLIESGEYEANFNGEAYSSIMFQNANLSVRLSDEFMQAVERDDDWHTHWVTDPDHEGPTYKARYMLREMAEGTWYCGDPGVQYETTINKWHTCKNSGRINASNPCVTGDTLVATDEGLRTIESLIGETPSVVGLDGNLHATTRVIPTGTKPVYRLRTKSGYEVKLTADHRVWTVNRGDVPAAELTKDDVIRLLPGEFGAETLDADVAEYVGLMLGDGCISDGIAQLTMSKTEEYDVAAKAAQVVNRFPRHRGEVRPTERETAICVATAASSVCEMLRRYAVLDAGSAAKRLTDLALTLDREATAALLRGLFTADGTVADYGEKSQFVSLDSTSLELLQQVQVLLLSFGIKSKLYRNRRLTDVSLLPDGLGGYKQYPVQQMHSLRITRSSRVEFERHIGFMPESLKSLALHELNQRVTTYLDRLVDPVVSLEPLGEQPVFDLTEPVTDHFVANGIAVHNCSEYMFLDDTACNLASINLKKCQNEDGTFDVERFRRACAIFLTAQEILVDHASYPTPNIAENSHLFRPLGLGYANLGSMLMSMGIPYDSDAGRGICGAITALLNGQGYLTSSRIAAHMGPFERYKDNEQPMLDVMQMHRDAVERINSACPGYLRDAARQVWNECLQSGRKYGYRNAQATVLAPTGTIAFMMDCDTTGIEPDIALVKYKQLAGGGMMKIVNRTVPKALQTLGYDEPQIKGILDYIENQETIEGAPQLKEEHLPVFDCAFKAAKGTRSIAWKAHVTMMAAAQPFLSGAISKTVNMPSDSTVEDIEDAYIEGWKLGLKALAIYRDGSKQSQPLATSKEGDRKQSRDRQGAEPAPIPVPIRKRLPDTRHSITHKFAVGNYEGYVTVGLFDDGQPGELFINMSKEGSTIGGLMDVIGTETSLALQYGVPLQAMIDKFSHSRFEPAGMTNNPDIPFSTSVVDYIFRWLGMTFIPGYREAHAPKRDGGYGYGGDSSPAFPGREGEDSTNPKLPSLQDGEGAAGQDASSTAFPGRQPAEPSDPVAAAISRILRQARPHDFPSSPALPGRESNGNGHSHTNGNGHGSSTAFPGREVGGNGASHAAPDASAKSVSAAALAPATMARAAATLTVTESHSSRSMQFSQFQLDAPACDNCGSITVRNGNCYLCHNCGQSMGCS